MATNRVEGSFPFPYSHSYQSVGYEHVLGDILDNWRTHCILDYMRRNNVRSARIDGLPIGPPPLLVPGTQNVSFVDLTTQFQMPPISSKPAVFFTSFHDTVKIHGVDPHWTGVDCLVSIEYVAETIVGPAGLWKRDEKLAGDIRVRVIEAMKIARRAISMEPKRSVFASTGPSHIDEKLPKEAPERTN